MVSEGKGEERNFASFFVAEFIHLLASEASEISERQHKKVISPEHIIEALQALGFTDYIEEVKAVFREYKEQAIVSLIEYVWIRLLLPHSSLGSLSLSLLSPSSEASS